MWPGFSLADAQQRNVEKIEEKLRISLDASRAFLALSTATHAPLPASPIVKYFDFCRLANTIEWSTEYLHPCLQLACSFGLLHPPLFFPVAVHLVGNVKWEKHL